MANIRQYMAWAEKRIGQLIIAEGLHCGLLGVVQGPLTLTFRVRLLRPSPAALRKLLGMGPALGAALQCGSVRVSQGPDAVLIEIPSPQPRTPSGQDLARYTRGKSICVGFDAMRRPVHVDLRQHGAVMWIGPSRRGKTQSMKCALFALARQVQSTRLRYVILSQKLHDWQPFAPAAGCMGVVGDPGEAEIVLDWTVRQLQDAATHGLDHTLIVVCDDLLNLLSRAPGIADNLAEIASMGAGLGVHLLAGTQVAGSKAGTGGAGVEANVTARIVYKSSTATAAARDAGQGGAGLDQLTTHKGDALLIVDGEPQRMATGRADDRDILQLDAGELVVAPWLRATASQPPHNRSQPVDNRLQPPQPPETHPPHAPHATGAAGGDAQPVVAVVAVADDLFPIDKREPTNDERDVIRQLHADGESLSALCRRVYGFKDGATFGWIKSVVTGNVSSDNASVALQQIDDDPDHIDLTTDAGRRQWREILGDVDWTATREQYADRRFIS